VNNCCSCHDHRHIALSTHYVILVRVSSAGKPVKFSKLWSFLFFSTP
jgi:hypothetical protein